MQDLVIYHENKPLKSCQLTKSGLVVTGSMSIQEWLQVGTALRNCQGATQWWIGDWLNYGERAYGEKYTQALNETDYKYGVLRNLKYVSGRVELSRRRDNLRWAHHQEIAPLEPSDQREWLEKAEKYGWSPASLRAELKKVKGSTPTWLKFTDVWNFTSCDERFGIDYPGRIPGQVLLNLMYYYTDKGDLVIDPTAGGGVTIDACKELKRKCVAFDLSPSRKDILQSDATQEWPTEDRARLIFIDPPYWSQKSKDYGGMASGSYDDFLADMQKVFLQAKEHLSDDGVMSILIAPVAIQHDYTDIPFDFVQMCQEMGFRLIRRISVPVSSQQVGPQIVEHCKSNKILVALIRDLLLFQTIR